MSNERPQFEIITESNIVFEPPFATKEEAVAKTAELGLGEMNNGDGSEGGWVLSVVTTV